MKVTIKHKQVRGVPKPKGIFGIFRRTEYYELHHVELYIELTNEEKAIVKRYDLMGQPVYDFDDSFLPADLQRGEMHHFYLRDCLENPFTKSCSTPLEAKQWENTLKTEILPRIKAHIQAGTTTLGESETFEM